MVRTGLLFLIMLSTVSFSSPVGADGTNSKGVYASRTIENGTTVQLIIDGDVIPAVLNGSKASQALLAKLPYSVRLQRYSHGYCGSLSEALPYDQKNLHNGWLNGDIVYSKDSNELAILYKDEEISENLYKGLVTLGSITSPLSTLKVLDRIITIRIATQ